MTNNHGKPTVPPTIDVAPAICAHGPVLRDSEPRIAPPLAKRIVPYADCLSTETFIRRIYGRQLSGVIAYGCDLPPSTASKVVFGGVSPAFLSVLSDRMRDAADASEADLDALIRLSPSIPCGYFHYRLSPECVEVLAETLQFMADLAVLEAQLQEAAASEDVFAMRRAFDGSPISAYVALVPEASRADLPTFRTVGQYAAAGRELPTFMALMALALLDHEVRAACWPAHQPKMVLMPLLPRYQGGRSTRVVRPELGLCKLLYRAYTGMEHTPTYEDLFPSNAEAMTKKVQRGAISYEDYRAAPHAWKYAPDPGDHISPLAGKERHPAATARVVFVAQFFAAKALGMLLDHPGRSRQHETILQLRRDYRLIWGSLLAAKPHFAGGAVTWDQSRFQRLIRDEPDTE